MHHLAFPRASLLLALGLLLAPLHVLAECAASEALVTGAFGDAWYASVAPTEHVDSSRSQVHEHACALDQVTGSVGPYTIAQRKAPASYPRAYNIATREPDELFLYGGYPGQGGAYVAKLDPDTLEEVWRATVTIPSTQWSFIGAMGVLGDGYVYSIQSNILAKIDPISGAKQELALPQLAAPTGTGAAYNGFVVTAGNKIVAKSMERGPCSGDGTGGLKCVLSHGLPSTVVVVNPNNMKILAQLQTSEPALGRIMTERHDGADYIYIPGASALVRYVYDDGVLALDPTWGPVPYGTSGANASGVGLLGDYAVTQTNYMPSSTPSWVVAAHIRDSSEQYAIQPFVKPNGTASKRSWVPDKAAMDSESGRIYAEDAYAGQIGALSLGPDGLKVEWKVQQIGTGFPALVGPPEARQLVIPFYSEGSDKLAWRDPISGALLAISGALAPVATVGVPGAGFEGRFYYPSFSTGELIELTASAP